MSPRAKGKRISVVSGVGLLTVLTLTCWFFSDRIRFWWLFEPLGGNEQGYSEYRHRQTVRLADMEWHGDQPRGPAKVA